MGTIRNISKADRACQTHGCTYVARACTISNGARIGVNMVTVMPVFCSCKTLKKRGCISMEVFRVQGCPIW